MCDRIEKLYNNWDVLISEACSDALMELKEQNEEYTAALEKQNAAVAALEDIAASIPDDSDRYAFKEHIDTLLYGVGTGELRACYLAGAGDAIRLACKLGFLNV